MFEQKFDEVAHVLSHYNPRYSAHLLDMALREVPRKGYFTMLPDMRAPQPRPHWLNAPENQHLTMLPDGRIVERAPPPKRRRRAGVRWVYR